jgi:hypothetical protein
MALAAATVALAAEAAAVAGAAISLERGAN